MKNYYLLLLATIMVTVVNAQETSGFALHRIDLKTPLAQNNKTALFGQVSDKKLKSEQHYKNLRTIGIVTTAAGVAFEVIGINMTVNHMTLLGGGESNATSNWGAGGMLGGALATAGGITMWVMGNRRLKKVRKLNLEQSGNNLSLVYKF